MKKPVALIILLFAAISMLASCQTTSATPTTEARGTRRPTRQTTTATASPSETPTLIETAEPSKTPTPNEPTLAGPTQVSPKDGMVMVFVPKGDFQMGNEKGESNEKPQHTVYLDAYWIDHTEVTNAMFAKFVKQTDYKTDAEKQGLGGPLTNTSELDNHPVVKISWNDANAYCKWAGKKLPTEAQWEKAARGPDGRIYPWGDQEPTCAVVSNSGCTDTSGTQLIDTSPYGALIMASSQWEWTADYYSFYWQSRQYENPIGPHSGENHVVRGGSWDRYSHGVRSSFRSSSPSNRWNYFLGFRCAAVP